MGKINTTFLSFILITGCKSEKCWFLEKYKGKLGVPSYTIKITWKDRLKAEGMGVELIGLY